MRSECCRGCRSRLQTVQDIAAVCFKMAPKDLARARRIADSRISPDAPAYRPYTLGLMAQAIAAGDRAGAARLIDDAYRRWKTLPPAGSRSWPIVPSRWRRVCSPSLSRSNRNDLAEYLGRTLAFRPATGDQTDPNDA